MCTLKIDKISNIFNYSDWMLTFLKDGFFHYRDVGQHTTDDGAINFIQFITNISSHLTERKQLPNITYSSDKYLMWNALHNAYSLSVKNHHNQIYLGWNWIISANKININRLPQQPLKLILTVIKNTINLAKTTIRHLTRSTERTGPTLMWLQKQRSLYKMAETTSMVINQHCTT